MCAANPCAAENPCAADEAKEVSDEEAAQLYACLTDLMEEQVVALEAGQMIEGPSWLLSDRQEARAFLGWEKVSTVP